MKSDPEVCWSKCFEASSRKPDFGLPIFGECMRAYGEVCKDANVPEICPHRFDHAVAAGMKDAK